MKKEVKDLLQSALVESPHDSEVPSAWIGHIPFASWIVKKCRPGIFVELGTHWGHSYFSVCNSVKQENLSTKCFAVDTWQGDEHAGMYDDIVYKTVINTNKDYVDFSHLMKCSFDEAQSKFDDQSIDLLHIDGLHTYDAVKHDFENWLPKVKNEGIVMFHDICVTKKDFGVSMFWKELKLRYPLHLEFTHCNGLGVICLKTDDISDYDWINSKTIESKEISKYFEMIGERFQKKVESESMLKYFKRENEALHGKVGFFENKVIWINITKIQSAICSLIKQR
jgi:Methyltransferase domain